MKYTNLGNGISARPGYPLLQCTIPSRSLGSFLKKSLLVFSHICSIQYSVEFSGEKLHIFNILLVSNSFLSGTLFLELFLAYPAGSAISPQPESTCFCLSSLPPSCYGFETLSRQFTRVSVRIISFVSCLSGTNI